MYTVISSLFPQPLPFSWVFGWLWLCHSAHCPSCRNWFRGRHMAWPSPWRVNLRGGFPPGSIGILCFLMNIMKKKACNHKSYWQLSWDHKGSGLDRSWHTAEQCRVMERNQVTKPLELPDQALPEVITIGGLFAGYKPINCLRKLDSGFLDLIDLQSKAP